MPLANVNSFVQSVPKNSTTHFLATMLTEVTDNSTVSRNVSADVRTH